MQAMRWKSWFAELGAAFLAADLGLEAAPRADHAAYIASWLKVLKDDKRAIFSAAGPCTARRGFYARDANGDG